MERALSEGRVLITEDCDFGELVYAREERGHEGSSGKKYAPTQANAHIIAPARGVVGEIPVYTNQRRPRSKCWHNREASMRALIAGLGLASMLAAGTAAAQLAPFNEAGVTMGHWHFASRDVQANKKIFVTMGGRPITGGNETVLFPGVRINLSLGDAPGSGESVGSVVNHVGFIVVDIPGAQLRFAKADTPQAPTKGRVLDHIGFDVKDLQSFVKKIEADGIKLDEPVRKNDATGVALTYITDPWGTRIELVQRPPSP